MLYSEYKPTPKQLAAHISPYKYKLYGGSMGSGKSYWLCAEVIRLSLMFPKNRILIARFRGKDLRRTTLPILLEMIPNEILKNYNKTEGLIELVNGSAIYASDLEDPNKLKSLNLGAFAIDEATDVPDQTSFNMLTTRLRLDLKGIKYFGLAATNPEPGWVKDLWVANPKEEFKFFQALPSDNPYLPPSYFEDVARNLPPSLRLRYLEGSWDAFDNQILDPSWIISNQKPVSDSLFKISFVDPAISEKQTADETSITTISFDKRFGYYQDVEVVHGRWNFETIKANIVANYERQKPDLLYIENVQAQDWLVQDIQKLGIPAQGFKPDRDKIRKALFVQDLFSTGIVYVNNPVLQKQCIEFPNGTHDDVFDSFISALFIAKTLSLKSEDRFKNYEAFGIQAIRPQDVVQNQAQALQKAYQSILS